MKCLSLVASLGHMQEMRMNVKHLDTVANIEIHGFKILVNQKLV